MSNRHVMMFIAMSLDGYIAANDDNLDFLAAVEQEGEDYGYAEFMATVDTVILGRRTYDKVISMSIPFPYGERKVYVHTRTPRPDEGNITFYTGELKALVAQLKSAEGKNIFVDGGAETVNALLKENLIEECTISIIPVLLGGGISLFQDGRPEQKLQLVRTASFEKGLVQLHYRLTQPAASSTAG